MHLQSTAGPAEAATSSLSLLEQQRHVLEMIVRAEPLDAVLRELCLVVESQAASPARAAILLLDPATQRLSTGAAPGLPAGYNQLIDGIAIAPDLGTCASAAATNRVVVTPDIENDPQWSGLKSHPLALGLVAAWSMPIVSARGEVLGTFGTYFMQRREPTAAEQTLVGLLSHTAALAIMRRQSDDALRESEARHRFFADLAAATHPLSDANALIATSARMLAEQIGADRCAYARIEDNEFVITGDFCRDVPSIVGRWPVAAFGKECERKMLAGEAYVVSDSESDARIAQEDVLAYRATLIRAVICVPLHKNGEFTAAMAVHQRVPRSWDQAEVQLARHTVASCWEMLERASVTRELQVSEARYRAMIEANPECVKLIAADGTMLRVNAAGLRMMGAQSESELVGAPIHRFIAPEHREAFRDLTLRVQAGEQAELSYDVIGLRGERRSLETLAVPMAMPGVTGRVQLTVSHDVTGRVAIDRALAESRARLEYAVRLSGIGFWYCDLPFENLIWDERVREHFSVSAEERVDMELFYSRIHPDDREPTRQAIETSIEQHAPYDVVYRTVAPSGGAIKWIRALGGTAYSPDGAPLRFDGVTVDVTRQRQDQERLNQLLQRERRQARLLTDLARTSRVLHASPTIAGVLNVLRDGALQLCAGCEVAVELAEGSTAASCADGGFVTPLQGLDENVLAWLRVWRRDGLAMNPMDTIMLAQLAYSGAVALENATLYERLQLQDRRKDEFLATLAHELRNPLAPIRSAIDLMRRPLDPATLELTRAMMDRQLGHLVRMVDDLLDVSRVTRGKIALKKQPVELSVVIASALETTHALIEERGHELRVRVPDEPVMLRADPTRMAQVLTNLLSNAARYTLPGGRIELSVWREDDAVKIAVSDTGVGIPKAMLGEVFEVFTQIDRSIERSQGGLGIGLTLVRRLVELHGGTVKVRSPGPGGVGSEFLITLPAEGA